MLFLFHLFVQLRDVVKRFIDISAIYFNLMKAARNDEDENTFWRNSGYASSKIWRWERWQIKIVNISFLPFEAGSTRSETTRKSLCRRLLCNPLYYLWILLSQQSQTNGKSLQWVSESKECWERKSLCANKHFLCPPLANLNVLPSVQFYNIYNFFMSLRILCHFYDSTSYFAPFRLHKWIELRRKFYSLYTHEVELKRKM